VSNYRCLVSFWPSLVGYRPAEELGEGAVASSMPTNAAERELCGMRLAIPRALPYYENQQLEDRI
jgi:hypothetical protein